MTLPPPEPKIAVICDAALKRPYGMYVQLAYLEASQAGDAVDILNLFADASLLHQQPGKDMRVVKDTRANWQRFADQLRRQL